AFAAAAVPHAGHHEQPQRARSLRVPDRLRGALVETHARQRCDVLNAALLGSTAGVLPRRRLRFRIRSSEAAMNISHRLRLSGIVAAIGVVIGASIVAQQPPTAPSAAN